MAFGVFPRVTLATARKRHHDARSVLEAGMDPMAFKKEASEPRAPDVWSYQGSVDKSSI
ncbi:Arm DNA-binding domain-containing protein [Achromobacter sp. ACM05]|nr:Arm DNA-binding domain-containing protein [Achromobacter sp. ACM05]